MAKKKNNTLNQFKKILHKDFDAKYQIKFADQTVTIPQPQLKIESSDERKNTPVFSGVLQYFPLAIQEVAKHSKRGNDKHNPGQPLHWAKDKSKDHADCIARHLIDIGPNWDQKDPETGSYHATALAWRALALLQILLEKERL